MNEYEKLITYLNSVINDINNKSRGIEERNVEQSLIKTSLGNIVELIVSHRINEINIAELSNLLGGLVSDEEINSIRNKLAELLLMQSFLFDERISNPIKQIMLLDLDNIRSRLNAISNEITQISLPDEDIRLLDECKKYLDIVNENGYTRILTDEERIAFYNFLRSTNLDDTLLLISDYIAFANKNKKQLEINTSNTAIEIINKNAEEVLKELEKNIKGEEEKVEPVKEVEPLKTEMTPSEQARNINFDEVYGKIIELLNMHQNDINPATYDIYKNYFSGLDIYEIYSRRSNFSTVDGVNWEVAIPCIREKLLPNINSDGQLLIFKIFNEIIALNQTQLERYQQEKQEQETYRVQLESFKNEFIGVVKRYDELRIKLNSIIGKINEQTRNNKRSISSLLEVVHNSSANDEGVADYLKHYGVSYDELKIYKLNSTIQSNINDIKEFIEFEMLSEDDFKDIYVLLEETKSIIEECEESYSIFKANELAPLPPEQGGLDEPTPSSQKQYEYGKSVIVFFRKDENSKFLVEEDIDRQLVDEGSYSDIHQILKRTSETSHDSWGKALSDPNHFKSFIDYNKQNGDRGDVVTLESDYSHETYEFFRLKDKGKTIPRLSAFDINMCDENRRKLGIPKDKHIILIIGEKQVTKFSNESQEYSDVRRELKNNMDLIKKYIELFENPSTSEEVLYKILNDSSDLYNYFKGKAKGLGE